MPLQTHTAGFTPVVASKMVRLLSMKTPMSVLLMISKASNSKLEMMFVLLLNGLLRKRKILLNTAKTSAKTKWDQSQRVKTSRKQKMI